MRRFPFRKTLLVVLLLVLGTWGLVELAAWRAGSRLESRFSTIADGLSVQDRYVPVEQNRTVEELLEIGTRLGIRMVTSEQGEAALPEAEVAESWRVTQSEIRDFLLAVRRQEEDAIPRASSDLEEFLAREVGTLDRLRSLLRTEEQPVWSMDLSAGFASKIPNYLGVMALQRLLIVDSLENWRQGDELTALHSLEASWRLNEAIADHPYLIAKLVAVAILNEQIPVLLRMNPMSPEWQDRLRQLDPQAVLRRGLELEAWASYYSAREGRLEDIIDRKLPRIARSYLRWGFYDLAGRMLDVVDDLPNEHLTTFDSDRSFDEHTSDIPPWNLVARLGLMTNFYNAWLKASRAELALDLVIRVAKLRVLVEAGELSSIPAREISVLEDLAWEVKVSAAAVEISLDGDLDAVQENPLPLSYRLSLAGAPNPEQVTEY